MYTSRPKTRRQHRLYRFTCPVIVEKEESTTGRDPEEGLLYEIGVTEARCHLKHQLPQGSPVTLKVFPRHPECKPVVMVFQAVVAKAGKEPPYETVFRFRGHAKVRASQLKELIG